MKDISLFLLKNSLAAKMKKGLRNICNGVGSTSTLNQQTIDRQDVSCLVTPSLFSSSCFEQESNLTLEEMMLKLDLEEAARRERALHEEYPRDRELRRRMSCVNNSDILRSARNALNQYPRFSLDGRDSLYRSSFKTLACVQKSVCCEPRNHGLPRTLGGESVVWCKPGIVPKLMGLEAMPVPIRRTRHLQNERLMNSSSNVRRQNLRRVERHEMQKRIPVMGMHNYGGNWERESIYDC